MKKLFLLITILVSVSLLYSQEQTSRPKIGLSLAGGGAKGFAHIGVLKVIDSLGIKIDYVSGTSMGAIVGGLYASGYTAKDIEKIVLETDFYDLIANEKTREQSTFFNKTVDKYLLTLPVNDGKINIIPTAISTGQKNIYMLKELFKNVSSVEDFSKLPIPFLAVATNLESGTMKILDHGDLTNSIMASSAFPSLMDPVKIGDSLYIDGAMTVNFPSKPLKDRGMDIVIGVDISQGLAKRENLNTVIDILNQVTDYAILKETQNQYNYTDILIHPVLPNITATSYDQKEKTLELGYQEALKYIPTLETLPKRQNVISRAPVNSIFSNIYKIDSLTIENNEIFGTNYVLGKMGLKLPSLHSYGSINKMIDKLYATNNYRLINYDLVKIGNKNILNLKVQEQEARFFLRFGLHYDEIFKTGLLLNATAKRLLFKNSTISLDLVVGDKSRYYFNYLIDNGYIPGFGLYSSGMKVELRNKDSNVYQERVWLRNEAFIQSVWQDKYAIGGGLSHDYFDVLNLDSSLKTSDNYINPYFFIRSDSRNDIGFPTRGFYLNAEGKFIDLFNSEQRTKIFQAKGDVRINIPIKDWYTNRVNLFTGITLGEDLPTLYEFIMGGIFDQNLGNAVSFMGYNFGQHNGKNIVSFSNDFQFHVEKNFFVTPSLSLATIFEKLDGKEMLRFNYSSVGLTLGYKSPFGQIKVNYSKAFNTGNNGLFSVILGQWF